MAGVTRPTSVFRLRRGLTVTWETANPILADGEPGIEVIVDGPERLKFGDGVTPWNDLEYAGGSGAVSSEIVALVGDVDANLLLIYTTARDGV